MAEIFRLQICRADHLRFALFIYAKHTIKIEKSQSKLPRRAHGLHSLRPHFPAEPKDPFRLAELQHHRDCQGQRPEPVPRKYLFEHLPNADIQRHPEHLDDVLSWNETIQQNYK